MKPSTVDASKSKALLLYCCMVALALAFVEASWAEVYSYECDSLPDAAGWTLFQAFCNPQQWVDGGLLFQGVPMCEEFPGQGAQFDYEKPIEDLAGAAAWFIEWRVVTTGISEELIYVAPAALVASNGNGFVYHFSIADDMVRFQRDVDVPVLYFEIEPGMHTYRVEVFGQDLGESYAVYIDGDLVDSGQAEGPFYLPPYQAEVKFRSKAKFVPSVSTWDYIRWGQLQIPGSGDFNSDGQVDDNDLYFFQECLETEAGSWPGCVAWADFDGDGSVSCADAAAFQEAWTGPGDPPTFPQCSGSSCPADLDGSNTVDAGDLAQLLGAWGDPGCSGTLPCPPDLNDDDLVNASDLAQLLGAWGACQ